MRRDVQFALYAVIVCAAATALLAIVEPALACFPRSACGPRGAPGPLIGVGLPLAGAAFATLLIVRRFRRKE